MTDINPAAKQHIEFSDNERCIAQIIGQPKQPTVIFTGAIHGNEGSGVTALRSVLSSLDTSDINGNIFAFIGNIQAWKEDIRFVEEDLNRVWSAKRSSEILENIRRVDNTQNEAKEQVELFHIIEQILKFSKGPIYFVDLHSVSSLTQPFIAISDTLNNRRLSSKIPVPIILGLEEYISGSMLSRVDVLGYPAIAFEGGAHNDPETVENHKSFIQLVLHHTGIRILTKEQKNPLERQLSGHLESQFYEVRFRLALKPERSFTMQEGFSNFSPIKPNAYLAELNDEAILSPFSGLLFMPLYQQQGSDGFFIVRKIHPFPLWLSSQLRKVHWTKFLSIMPGVKRVKEKPHRLKVNRLTARFFVVPLFHLLGYQCRFQNESYLIFDKRDIIPK